jgi:glycyl-tRNA synthetase beta chain
VVRAEGLIARQPDSEERVWGPRKRPRRSRRGFREEAGLSIDQLEVLSDGKAKSTVTCARRRPRRSRILAEALPQLVLKTPFPKTMYWTGKGGVRFIRPIRWIVALLDDR